MNKPPCAKSSHFVASRKEKWFLEHLPVNHLEEPFKRNATIDAATVAFVASSPRGVAVIAFVPWTLMVPRRLVRLPASVRIQHLMNMGSQANASAAAHAQWTADGSVSCCLRSHSPPSFAAAHSADLQFLVLRQMLLANLDCASTGVVGPRLRPCATVGPRC